jgi:hypothetical protein
MANKKLFGKKKNEEKTILPLIQNKQSPPHSPVHPTLFESEKRLKQASGAATRGAWWRQVDVLGRGRRMGGISLPVLMDLYIYPLYVLVSKIFSSILNSLAPIHHLYHPLSTLSIIYIILYPLYPLWDPLVTLSKYIHV